MTPSEMREIAIRILGSKEAADPDPLVAGLHMLRSDLWDIGAEFVERYERMAHCADEFAKPIVLTEETSARIKDGVFERIDGDKEE